MKRSRSPEQVLRAPEKQPKQSESSSVKPKKELNLQGKLMVPLQLTRGRPNVVTESK